MSKFTLAIVQLVSTSDIEQNLARVERWVAEAASGGAQLVLLPENFALFESKRSLDIGAAEADSEGPIRRFIAGLAKRFGVWIIAGSLPCAQRPDGASINGRVRSACWVFDDSGDTVARYDKIHLFDVDVKDAYGAYRESAIFEPGEQVVVIDTPWIRIGLSICYDLRFPELFRAMAEQGAELVTVPSAFTYVTGEAHWETLLRARAIENQVFIAAANQGGRHSESRRTYGHSMVIDPWGKVVAGLEEGEGVILSTLDKAELQEVRTRMPVLAHRKLK
ncbi:carbon-nitrogen hydrolase family protein [Hahella aquimaris]|uniref:carbon-nitrogen hydrolase family protein n=1 Tax=Hahella sp. HNIBRBA332 TaxID=3015983 RepID=UPI00273BB4DE|nr:carbon-nitrogen hydrolase family protein [Hahella sp. HNIBRBA332]WLQ14579.1 carbon-nitrogen hydrolase family protein [Hahella sp. HNIBRBA332]